MRKKAYIGALSILTMLAVAALLPDTASAQQLSMKQLEAQLRQAKQHQRQAVERERIAAANLVGALTLQATFGRDAALDAQDDDATIGAEGEMQLELAASLLADGVVTDEEVGAMRQNVATTHKTVARWTKKVRQLQTRILRRKQIARWNRNGQWWPLIKIAANKYGVSPSGLRRLMILESSGRRYAGFTYKGLFQYCPGTWRGRWNPWRRQSIYNGWAQIQATAYALSKGMGPGHWPNTYPLAF